MEYNTWLDWVLPNLSPAPPNDFKDYISNNPTLLQQYADMLMYTLPSPRYKWYQPSNFQKIQDQVTVQTNKAMTNLGFYEYRSEMSLMKSMKLSSAASLLLGLLFGIIVILFVVISILLIYSLLMISVETKTFENGVLRLVGLSKANCISMILIQSFMFVIPSIISAYVCSIPALWFVYRNLFTDNNVNIAPIPEPGATV